MGHSTSLRTTLSSTEFNTFAAGIVSLAPKLSAGQMLELADQLHDLIRTRRVAERSFAQRHGQRPPEPRGAEPDDDSGGAFWAQRP